MRNIIEAAKLAAENGQRIFCEDKGEWIEYSSGSFRYINNRMEVKFSLKDITSNRWLCESDFIVTHRGKIMDAMDKFLTCTIEDYEDNLKAFIEILKIDRDVEKVILNASKIVPVDHA